MSRFPHTSTFRSRSGPTKYRCRIASLRQRYRPQKRRASTGRARNSGVRTVPGLSLLAVILLIGSCAPAPPHVTVGMSGPVQIDPHAVAVLLVAGDGSSPVFGNAVRYMRDKLLEAGIPEARLHILTDDERGPHEASADLAHVLAGIRALKPPADGGCLVFFTSHGVHQRGFYLAPKGEVMKPEALDAALQAGCGTKPTAVVVSSCYAGRFAAAPMTRDNRVIIAASSADRSSFGCSADDVLTYFDDCLLGSMAGTTDWKQIFENTRQCVALREDRTEMQASQPQAWFGRKVRSLSTPFVISDDEAEKDEILFTPGEQDFIPRRVPIAAADRTIIMPTLKHYARAASPKALAYAPFGFANFSSVDTDWDASSADVARLALQRCEWLTGGACVLFARDNRTVARLPSGLPPYHPSILRRVGTLTPETTPFIRDDERPRIEAYLKLPGKKALALSPNRSSIGIGQGDAADAARKSALTACRQGGTECVVYAENDHVVLGW